MVFPNAREGGPHEYFTHKSVAVDVNLVSVPRTLMLARSMRAHGVREGSVVVTNSAVAYALERSLRVYTASKFVLVGLVRSLRPTMLLQAATVTNLLPPHLAALIVAMGLPTREARFVGRTLVYAATTTEGRRVEAYGKESSGDLWPRSGRERWNGRIIRTLGDIGKLNHGSEDVLARAGESTSDEGATGGHLKPGAHR